MTQVPHQDEICFNQHNEGWVLGYLCKFYAHGGISSSGIEGI
jgi:hypothetical protein